MEQLSFFITEEQRAEEYKKLDKIIYGKGISIMPFLQSKNSTPNERKRYLQHLLPLEEYDKILVFFSGGKDSIASFLYLLDLGVSKDKILLLHHDIDGEQELLKMDWPMTKSYCIQFAKAFGVDIKFSWREDGFAGELFRVGASKPIIFEELNEEKIVETNGANWARTKELEQSIEKAIEEDNEELAEELMRELKSLGYRMKFPAKSASLSTRWCSSALKIEVSDRLLRYSALTSTDCRVLVVDGIRREESSNRSRYNEMELHTTHAPSGRRQRIVHHWRPIIEWSEEMVWDMFKEYKVRPHGAYLLGWNRCSCSMCIFSLPKHWKGIQEVLPEGFNKMVKLEEQLDFTIDNKKDLLTYIEGATSCLPPTVDEELLNIMRTGKVPEDYILLKEDEEWSIPYGAYQGGEGGPC